MADSTIDSELFMLIDNWPGVARRVSPDNLPNGDIISAVHHNVTTAVFPIGDKIVVRNRSAVAGDDGDSTFIYLKGLAITEANPACAAKQLCVPSLAGTPYQVTNDSDQCLDVSGCPLVAVLLSVMTFTHAVTKYGWFWCGGVAPEAMVAAMGATTRRRTPLTSAPSSPRTSPTRTLSASARSPTTPRRSSGSRTRSMRRRAGGRSNDGRITRKKETDHGRINAGL